MTIHTFRRALGWAIIILALWFLTPPGLPPDDIINLVVGGAISELLNVPLLVGIVATYTVIPLLLIILGCVIIPGRTIAALQSVWGKIRPMIIMCTSRPWLLALAIIIISIGLYVYVVFIQDAFGLGG